MFIRKYSICCFKQLVERFSADFLADVDDYVAHVQESVEHNLGRCGPLSSAYNATTAAFCKDVLYPFVSLHTNSTYCVELEHYLQLLC